MQKEEQNMKLKKWISLFLIAIFLCTYSGAIVQVSAAEQDNQEEEYTINAPYEYPIKPGTEEWKLITSRIERAEKCQIPEDILSRMTTEALAKTVLEYPFMVDMYAWNTTSIGYQVIKSEFNGLQELEMRPDGLETLQSMSQMRSTDGDGSSLRSRYLDIIISEMTQKDTVLYRDESQLQTRGNLPTTPLGNTITEGVYENLTWADHNLTFQEAKTAQNEFLETYPSTSIYQNVNPSYNCHSFAWHSQSVDNTWWIDDPSLYMTDGSYYRIYSWKTGAKIFYGHSTYWYYDHSAIALSSNDMVRSKWGSNACFEHNIEDCPYVVGDCVIKYYTR